MNRNKYIWLISVTGVLLILLLLWLYYIHQKSAETDAFRASLGNLTHDIAPIESIEATSPYSFQALEDVVTCLPKSLPLKTRILS
jgi:hypothetical protein